MKDHVIPDSISSRKIKNKNGDYVSSSVVYPYYESSGAVFAYKARYEWPDDSNPKGKSKTFRYYSLIDGKIVFKKPRKSFYPVFRADEIEKLDRNTDIVFVEGEKAATCRLAELTETRGYFFTCVLDEKKTDFSQISRFKNVYIIPDKDESGDTRALELKVCIPHAKVLVPPNELPEKGDIADLDWTDGLDLYIETAEEYIFDNADQARVESVVNKVNSDNFHFTMMDILKLAATEEAKQFVVLKEHKQAADVVTLAFSKNVIYCEAEKKFFYYNGNVWKELISIIDAVLFVIYEVAKTAFSGKNNKDIIKLLATVSKKNYADSVIGILKQKTEIYKKSVPWNHNQSGKWVLKDEIITVNKEGRIIGRPGERDEYFNNPLPYSKQEIIDAGEPERYINDLEIYFPDESTRETAEFLLSVIFSGDISFKKIPIMVGLSDTGKSTLLKSLGHGVFPGLFDSMPAEVVCPASKSYDNGESPSPQLAKLIDHRVLGVFEIEQGRRAATGLLKTVSGGDPITARRLRENPITFNPSAYIVLCTNFLPNFAGGDAAFCNRLIVLPFTNPIAKISQRTPDQITDEFREEAPAIIKRMIRHYKKLVFELNRVIPESEQCLIRKRKYVKNNDDVGLFIEQCLKVDMDDENAVETLENVSRVYRAFFSLSEKEIKNSQIARKLINRMEEIESSRVRDKSSKKLIGVLKNIKIKDEYKEIMFGVDEYDVSPDEYLPSRDPKYKNENSEMFSIYQ